MDHNAAYKLYKRITELERQMDALSTAIDQMDQDREDNASPKTDKQGLTKSDWMTETYCSSPGRFGKFLDELQLLSQRYGVIIHDQYDCTKLMDVIYMDDTMEQVLGSIATIRGNSQMDR